MWYIPHFSAIKREATVSGKSFAVYDEKYHPALRIRFSLRNGRRDGNILNLPVFLADWLKNYLPLPRVHII